LVAVVAVQTEKQQPLVVLAVVEEAAAALLVLRELAVRVMLVETYSPHQQVVAEAVEKEPLEAIPL
jgi:hypothetical protein